MTARGVTLIELVVSLAILSLVLGISAVTLASLRPPRESEERRLVEHARAEAILSGRPIIGSGPLSKDTAHRLFLPDGRVVAQGFDLITGVRLARP